MTRGFISTYTHGSRSTKAIYGIILISAALIGFQLHESNPATIAVKVFFAGLVIVLAEVYSEILGEKIKRKKELTRLERREIIGDATVISSVATYPLIIFLLSALGLYSVEFAFELSYALGIVGLGLFGYVAACAAGDSKQLAIRKAVLTAFVGIIVILVKYSFGH